MYSLIIGFGEVGKAVFEVLNNAYPHVFVLDPPKRIYPQTRTQQYDYIHICFSYYEGFVEQVKKYQEETKCKYTIIHSTVPVGTSRLCGAVHSPVVGMHPELKESLLTFTRFLAGEKASEVADYFRKAGMKVYLFDKQETTEYLKLRCTEKFGIDVEHTKDVKRGCDERDIPFEAWSIWVDDYNRGYQELGHDEFTRHNLVPIMRPIGGHCVLPNAGLLETPFSKLLKELNETDQLPRT